MRNATAAAALAAAAVPLLLAPPASASAASAPAAGAPVVTREQGYAISCNGAVGRKAATVELYTNSTVAVPASVVLETPRTVLVSADGSAAPRIARGKIASRVRLVNLETLERAGKATVTGTYRRTGPVTEVDDDFTDAGHRVQVKGTNQALRVEVRLTYGHRSAWLTCDDAFAFDLTVVKTPL